MKVVLRDDLYESGSKYGRDLSEALELVLDQEGLEHVIEWIYATDPKIQDLKEEEEKK